MLYYIIKKEVLGLRHLRQISEHVMSYTLS